MAQLNVVIEEGEVDDFAARLPRRDVEELEQVVMLHGAMSDGRPAVLLVATIDGEKRAIKTSLRLLMTACSAMNGAAEMRLGASWRGL